MSYGLTELYSKETSDPDVSGFGFELTFRLARFVERCREATGGAGLDRIIEVDFAANVDADLAALRPEGDIVVYGSGAPEIPIPFVHAIVKGARLRFFIVYNLNPEDRSGAIADLTRLLAENRLAHNVAARLPLAQIADAHEMIEQGKAMENVVLALQ